MACVVVNVNSSVALPTADIHIVFSVKNLNRPTSLAAERRH